MKTLPFAILLLTSLLAPLAEACSRNETQFICPGDRVVATNRDNHSWGGIVSAVNPFRGTVSIRHDDGDLATWEISQVALGVGCIQGYCVGDYVVATNRDNHSWGGRIVAVNPYNQTVAIRHDDGDLASWAINNVSLGLGCIRGYCVGDRVVATNRDNNSWGGRIVAVNPFNQTVAIYHDDGDLANWQIDQVGNSRYCADYGDEARQHARFPILNEGSYRVAKWKYGLQR